MLTGFKARQDIQKTKEAQSAKAEQGPQLELLKEAIAGVLNDNSHRVYIEDYPYLVEFKLPSDLELSALQKALAENKIKLLDSKSIGVEIISHTFALSSNGSVSTETSFEVLYKPLPRMRR